MFEYNRNPVVVIQKYKHIVARPIFTPIATVVIYSMIIPLIIVDIWAMIYQAIYFSVYGIPKIKKKDFISFDRWNLDKLNIFQKINCLYCEYANGTTAWLKAITNQTEVYSCAIKFSYRKKGDEYQKDFYDYKKFDN